jgi:hypothetical protein
MPTRAEWCRVKAGECTALAAVSDRVTAFELRELAQLWLQLADDVKELDQRQPYWVPFEHRRLH